MQIRFKIKQQTNEKKNENYIKLIISNQISNLKLLRVSIRTIKSTAYVNQHKISDRAKSNNKQQQQQQITLLMKKNYSQSIDFCLKKIFVFFFSFNYT